MMVLDLNGEWTVRQGARGDAFPAQVPGDVYADLLNAGRIPDPFYRNNEEDLQWIGEASWVYRRIFQVPEMLLERTSVLLHCHGLDTFATVSVNGKPIAKTDNMFRTYEWDVKPLLKAGENRIEVRFDSTIPYINRRQKEHPIPCWGIGPDGHKAAHHGWVRKEQCNYGWDWGIKAVTCGIWRNIHITAFDVARLEDVHITQDHSHKGVIDLCLDLKAEIVAPTALRAKVVVAQAGEEVARQLVEMHNGKARVVIPFRDASLWWPNGMGGQPLYEVRVTLLDAADKDLDWKARRIGLRTLSVDRHPDKWGESFQFVVNGIPFFAKGANWIPADAIQARVNRTRYRALLRDAVRANMNMIRVWGGGIYEDDHFYDACDEFGLCVWQDFMFACSGYPTFDDDFMATVKAEAEDNVRRLRHHPCIALWCGNNELEQGVVRKEAGPQSMSWAEYKKLFDVLLPDVIQQWDPERQYWPSSGHSPHGDREDHANPTCGDAHLWEVWHGCKPFEWYRTSEHRFVSEFGFQSFPEPRTVDGYTLLQDQNVTSYVMEHHQRSRIGNAVIMQYMLDWFRMPTLFEMTLWTSQILHGMAMKYAVEHWRRSMPRTMGTLYWQLNDTWPVASWASIDYHGRWKALHYMARDFYAPVLISGVENAEAGTVEIHVTSDLKEPLHANVSWRVTDLAGKTLLADSKPVTTQVNGSKRVRTLRLSKLISQHGKRNLLVWLSLSAGDQALSNNLVLFARPKHLELAGAPGIEATVTKGARSVFEVTLTTQQPALWAWLELRGTDSHFSTNFVHLCPGVPVQISMAPATELTVNEVREKLVVRSLVDTYV